MIKIESITEPIPLPATPEGWFDYGYTALTDGRLALVRTRQDVHVEHMRWLEAVNGGDQSRKYPKVWGGDMRLSIFDGVEETDVAIMPCGAHPVVDRMPDGRWLVAGSRADKGERNGRIYAADGRKERDMALGDGIENLLCSADGTIWVGYFDALGTPIWSFNDQVDEDHSIADSYAMTLAGTDLWACFYTDFPIARISGGKPVFWSNSVAGARAIAVKDDIVVLGGGYGDDANRITVVKLDGKASRELGSLRYATGTRSAAGLLQGRGSVIHIVSDGIWSKVPVYKAMEAISRDPHY
ncbi:hypothetical protein ASD67_15730 [Sphingopyxis sp. Root1497]|uniref:hypothetical protein n=1 Tax=Sphingopyxis sp. Root1497 TaxID=1736474 RepID=UPI0006F968BB|nr:hypothetical protein [Sphingopyxis sp. Root1497]KQZ60756.1 hypothetical protein ASD67_15730 [Sphingopyxis sp. Root1497]